MNKASILQLIESGELETAVSQFVELAKNTRYETLALQLSSRLADLKNAEFAGGLSFDERSRQRSQISHSLIQLVQQFDGKRVAGGSFFSKNWGKVGAAVVFAIGILANLGDIKQAFFDKNQPPAPSEQPAVKPAKPAVQKEIPTEKPTAEKPVAQPKKQTNITVKDSAKVGIINTGDSPVFNIKQ